MNQLEGSTLMLEQSLPTALACSNVLNVLLDKQAMLRLQDAEVVSLDEIRLRC